MGVGAGGRGVGGFGEEMRALWVRNWVTRAVWRDCASAKGVIFGRWTWRRSVGEDIEVRVMSVFFRWKRRGGDKADCAVWA